MPECPSTPGCSGDPAWASPNGGHIAECQHPRAYDGPPLDIEFREHEGMTQALPQFMTLIYLFGAAVDGANRDERKALHECKEMLKQKKPLAEIAQAIFDARGPDWSPGPETMAAIEAINKKE